MATQPMGDPLTAAVLGPDVVAQQMRLQQAQDYAHALMQQGMQGPPQGRMVGNHYVAPSWTQGLASALQMYMGRKGLDDLPNQAAELGKLQADGYRRAFGIGGSPMAPDAAAPAAMAAGAANGDTGPTLTNANRMNSMVAGQPSSAPMYQSLPGRSPQDSMMTAMGIGIPEYQKLLAQQLAPSAEATRGRELGVDQPTQLANYNAEQLKKGFIEPVNVRPGGTVFDPVTKKPVFNAPQGATSITWGANGQPQASEVPGAADIIAKEAEAKAKGPAKFKMITVDTPQGPRMMTEAQAAQLSGGQDAGPISSTPGAMAAEPNLRGAFKGDAAKVIAEINAIKDPQERVNALSAYANQLSGNNPAKTSIGAAQSFSGNNKSGIDLQNDSQKTFGKSVADKAADSLLASKDKARSASDDLINIDEARKAIASGTYQGSGANAKLAVSKFINAMVPGVTVDQTKVGQTDYLKSVLGAGLLQQAKALGANPSNADAERINEIVGNISKDPKAMQMILDWRETMAKRSIKLHNDSVDDAEARGLQSPYDLRIKHPTAQNPHAGFEIIKVTP